MKRRTRRRTAGRRIALMLLIAGVALWLNNTSAFLDVSANSARLLAHRGLAQTFDLSQVKWDTDTSKIIDPPEHPYLENTLESMRAALGFGADVIELDVQLTKDKELAIFHDYLLDYRTDGQGSVSDFTMNELRQLDVGYGYTADGGQTYPFRGKFIGKMPSLREVLSELPEQDLLIHVKSNDTDTGEVLWDHLQEMTPERLGRITVYGSDQALQYLRQQHPTLRVMSKQIMIKAVLSYAAIGWSGYVPQAMRNIELHLPQKYARFLWGWPHRFVQRMEQVNTRVVLVNGDGEFSDGFDIASDLHKIPANFGGYIWTDRIDVVSQLLR